MSNSSFRPETSFRAEEQSGWRFCVEEEALPGPPEHLVRPELHPLATFPGTAEVPLKQIDIPVRDGLGDSVGLRADPDTLLRDEVPRAGDGEFREESTVAMKAFRLRRGNNP